MEKVKEVDTSHVFGCSGALFCIGVSILSIGYVLFKFFAP